MTRGTTALLAILVTFLACSKEAPPGASDASATSASAPAASSATAAASAAPSASAAPAAPRSDCPKGSTGPGTFDKPCMASGSARAMEAAWTGKTDEKGPHFRITNKSDKTILYGKFTAYFYDKAGKQLSVKDSGGGKDHPSLGCGGNIFGGVMKPGEKAVLTFSCVKKEQIPEGTKAIEGEISMVGFADSTEKKSEFYWRNDDLVPEQRKKGGVK